MRALVALAKLGVIESEVERLGVDRRIKKGSRRDKTNGKGNKRSKRAVGDNDGDMSIRRDSN